MKIANLGDLVAHIPDGAVIASPSEGSGTPIALTCEIMRAGRKRLHLLGGPTSGMQADLLIGAGCVETVQAAGVGLGPRGRAPRFSAAVQEGAILMQDSTCPAMHAAYLAGEKRLPFIAVRGIHGSDVLARRPDWCVMNNPFPPFDPVVVVPPLLPDIMILHAPFADVFGNVWIGTRRELKSMARASGRTFATVEKLVDTDLTRDTALAPGTLASPYVDGIAIARYGAWPTALGTEYPADDVELDSYALAAQSEASFKTYLDDLLAGKRRPSCL